MQSHHAKRHFAIDDAGCARGARQVHSPNQDERPQDAAISLIVVHGISLPPGVFGGPHIEALFTNTLRADADPSFADIADLRVSAHFLVRREGEVVQFVPCTARAWHAGVSCWNGRERCNDYSLGIELEGTDDTPYTDAQYAALARLLKALCARYPVREVVGHSDIAPGRKTDPGSAFDWQRLRDTMDLKRVRIGAPD